MTELQDRIAALPPEKRALLERRLAEQAAQRSAAPERRITPRDRARPTPLAFQQEREWAIGRFRPANNIPGAFRVEGALDIALLSRVLTEVVERHEVLRSTVELREDGQRVQVVHPLIPVPAPLTDLSDLSPERQRDEVMRRWKTEVVKPFDPASPLRLRISLLRMGENNHVVLITTDHAAADLVSVAILVREFAALYAGYQNGVEGLLSPLDIQYGDFAAWQRERGEKQVAAEVEHWRKTLEGIPGPLTLPSDRPFPARPTFAGNAHFVDLPADFAEELRTFIEQEKASLGVVLLAATSVLLYRYLGRDDMVVGEIVSGRSRAEVEQLIGCFVTALPLRMRIEESHSLREVLHQARGTVLTAYDHQDLPMERLIGELGLGHEASQTSMSHMWIDVRTPESTLEVPGLRISAEPIEVNVAAAPLTLDANPSAETLQLQWIYMTEMFDTATVELLADQFDLILRQFVRNPEATIAEVELVAADAPALPSTERSETGFIEVFQRRVAQTPHAPAVIFDGAQTSYTALNEEANRLAHRLRELGVGPETRVGILVDRSPRLPAAILGVLKAGGVFVPLDPGYPPERISYMLADADAQVLVTEQRQLAAFAAAEQGFARDVVLLDGPVPLPGGDARLDSSQTPAADTAAYVVYTSGSTGRPKGAIVEHRSLATFSRDVAERLGLGAGDRFLQFASPSFDVLIEELFPIWLAGGAVVIPSGHIISGQVDLVDLIGRERVSVMELPTAYWHEWVRELDRTGRELPDCMRLVIIGGERVLADRLNLWRRLGVPLLHVYGLTETTVSSTFFRLDPAAPARDWPNLPIGTPLPSADLRILDRRLRPVPVGAAGELYIGGVSVARGYLGRPALTAQRFVADPARPGERLYRTGDLVRMRTDGELEFISRVDTQIKIRGFRVEPTEIESVLDRHPRIAESVVTLYEPVPGDRRLVAYLVPDADADAAPGTEELRRFLERELPSYMVPSAFIPLDALPLTANGKVDHKRLPSPEGLRAASDEEYVAPETAMQLRLAEILKTVLGLGRIGIHDNFFEVGGDSILAIQVVARAQEEGLKLSPYDLFTNPTVASLAEVATAGPAIDADQADVTGPLPLAPSQRWFATAGMPDPKHWNRSAVIELTDPVEPKVLEQAVEALLGHHDALRSRFLLSGAKTRARLAPRGDVTPFEVHDVSGPDEAAQVHAGLQAGLDLAVGPLLRAALIRNVGGQNQLAIVVHRLVADDASLRILLEDLRTAVKQLTAGEQVRLKAKTTSWQSWNRRLGKYAGTDEVQSQRSYWTALAAEGTLPTDHDTADAGTVGAERVVDVELDAAVSAELLHAVPTALNCRTEELLLTALSRTLHGWTGAASRLIHVERYDRVSMFDDVDLGRTVGVFSRIHPLALSCDAADEPAASTLRTVKESLRTVPVDGTGWQLLRQDTDSPLPDAPADLLFGYLGELDGVAPAAGDDVDPRSPRRYPVEVGASVRDGRITLRWSYDGSRYERKTMEHLADQLIEQLRLLAGLELSADGLVHTPSDFPFARVDQSELDQLFSRL